MWFMTLDMASRFWAVPMTARAQLILAFICPLGHFQMKGMPFGLKNVILIYQQLLDNCLWGFVRLPPEEDRIVDTEMLEFLGISLEGSGAPVSQGTEPQGAVVSRTSTDTLFHQNWAALELMGPVLSRSSYIDDIIYEAPSWDDLCKTLNDLLYRLRLPKSELGVKICKYLEHAISSDGVQTSPKQARKKGVQAFLGSLNYCTKFIEYLPVLVATLSEIPDEHLRSGRELKEPKYAFNILKDRVVSVPLLQHPGPGRQNVIILHANPWAILLGQDCDGTILPVRLVGRVLQDAELRYHPAEKEVLELLRKIRVYTRYSVLPWLFKSKTVDGRCLKWAVNLSPWDLDLRRVENDEVGLTAILGAGINPRERLDEAAETLVPEKGSRIRQSGNAL
ncbi:reverse transcriptase [Phytophthora megakarya]|uniref:Reverse transcriptase n=1 Tax=Phytophthora megakarya TaxID=4795 RepID=A0A225VH52_9STRA|nr:reverse transcriptase [Phytophthora megakarya]